MPLFISERMGSERRLQRRAPASGGSHPLLAVARPLCHHLHADRPVGRARRHARHATGSCSGPGLKQTARPPPRPKFIRLLDKAAIIGADRLRQGVKQFA